MVQPLEDPESALHKKTDKNVEEKQPPKKSPFKDLKSFFGKKKAKNVGESSTSSKNKSKVEGFDLIPSPQESEDESKPDFELQKSEHGD